MQKTGVPNTTNTRRRQGQAALPSARHRDTDESPSPAHTPTSRRTRTPPTSLTDSEENDNSSSSATIPPHNLDSSTRVASLPNTEYFQQFFQRLRIAPTTSDISPPITQQTTSQVAIPYTGPIPVSTATIITTTNTIIVLLCFHATTITNIINFMGTFTYP